ncbi:hypothetical protein BGX38DRAFT_137649 [Terfezia claveryi]|nr:hypothetical protein BGX38DRAFT_137649 [Terfezia claveryi]
MRPISFALTITNSCVSPAYSSEPQYLTISSAEEQAGPGTLFIAQTSLLSHVFQGLPALCSFPIRNSRQGLSLTQAAAGSISLCYGSRVQPFITGGQYTNDFEFTGVGYRTSPGSGLYERLCVDRYFIAISNQYLIYQSWSVVYTLSPWVSLGLRNENSTSDTRDGE